MLKLLGVADHIRSFIKMWSESEMSQTSCEEQRMCKHIEPLPTQLCMTACALSGPQDSYGCRPFGRMGSKMHARTHSRAHTHTHTFTPIHAHTYSLTHKHKLTHTHSHPYIHTHTHTHSHTYSLTNTHLLKLPGRTRLPKAGPTSPPLSPPSKAEGGLFGAPPSSTVSPSVRAAPPPLL
jgi:hypothetical protein